MSDLIDKSFKSDSAYLTKAAKVKIDDDSAYLTKAAKVKIDDDSAALTKAAKVKTDETYQAMLDEAEREANKLRIFHEEERKKALIYYKKSSPDIDLQGVMKYVDSLEQSEGAEESQISKGRTR